MRLDRLLATAQLGAGTAVVATRGDLSGIEITGMVLDSREAGPGSLFCCVPGRQFDGHDFAGPAVAAGAAALLSERPLDLSVPQVVVPAVRAVLGPLADALYDHPSRRLTVAGITGTNGKTTTTELLAATFEADGRATATIGTLTGTRTTPEAPALQATLAQLRGRGVTAVAMEVSSHALDQHRVDSVHFAAATFTNLSQDHLDYHLTMDQYFAAKARLFEPGRTDVAVVNVDDRWGRRLLAQLDDAGTAGVAYSMADVSSLVLGPAGSTFVWDGRAVTLALPGRFNVANAVAAATTARQLGVPGAAIAAGLAAVGSVRGRFEPVVAGQAFVVLVDYAHTPDGLEQALSAARELGPGRLLVVVGAGGDRDRSKRPLMGEVVSRLADMVVLTSDNPRSEDPDQIIAEMRAGTTGRARLVIDPDRGGAIRTVLDVARPGDVVVIAGKGHEKGQEIDGRLIPFDDAEVARRVLADIASGHPAPGGS